MNIGQVLETHLGFAAKGLGLKIGRMLDAQRNAEELRGFLGQVYNQVGSGRQHVALDELADAEVLELSRNLRAGVPMATPSSTAPRSPRSRPCYASPACPNPVSCSCSTAAPVMPSPVR